MFGQPLSTTLAESDRFIAGLRLCVTRAVPLLQIAGAISALFAVISLAPYSTLANLVVFGTFLLLVFGLGVVSAFRLWRDGVSGRRYAFIHQCLLTPKLFLPDVLTYDLLDVLHCNVLALSFENAFGVSFDAGFVFGQLGLSVLAPSEGGLVYGVNLVPIAVIVMLRAWPDLQRRNEAKKYRVFN